MKRGRRGFASVMVRVAMGAALLAGSSQVGASVSVGASVVDLAERSSSVAVVTPIESRSEWQGRRIVTVHRLGVESVVAGEAPGSEVVVKTLGGSIGGVAQRVEGEAEFVRGTRSLVFLAKAEQGARRVTARGQGQFRIAPNAAGKLALFRNPRLGHLLRARDARSAEAAVETLHGASLESGLDRIVSTWRQVHAR
jgi:hypothetical protein